MEGNLDLGVLVSPYRASASYSQEKSQTEALRMLKSCYSCREAKFDSQHPHQVTHNQLYTPAPGDLVPLASMGIHMSLCICTHTQIRINCKTKKSWVLVT